MSDSPIAILTGGCQCGALRYALTAAPERVHFCHCRNCQPTPLITRSRRRTGSHETPRWREPDSNPRSRFRYPPSRGRLLFQRRVFTRAGLGLRRGNNVAAPWTQFL
jgi:hypothetical protein